MICERWEDKVFWTEWQEVFLEFNMLLTSPIYYCRFESNILRFPIVVKLSSRWCNSLADTYMNRKQDSFRPNQCLLPSSESSSWSWQFWWLRSLSHFVLSWVFFLILFMKLVVLSFKWFWKKSFPPTFYSFVSCSCLRGPAPCIAK